MDYKKSQYNLFVPYNDSMTIIFNTYSGAIGLFDQETMLRYNTDTLFPEEKELLIKKGVIIPYDRNEKNEIDKDRANGILCGKEKLIRIWTTSDCNARCYYCFEKGIEPAYMTKETADYVVHFICSLLKNGDCLTFEWFGGEPLLNTEIIDYIINRIRPICEQMHCTYQSTFISNGSLINDAILAKMRTVWHTKYIQITLDGDEKTYTSVKNYCNPVAHHFRGVISNIKQLVDSDVHVSIRMNYGTTNYESLSHLIDFLHEEIGKRANLIYYIYPLWSCLNEQKEHSFESKAVADSHLLKLFDKLVEYDMASARGLSRLNYKKNQCSSCSTSSYTIFPNGKIGKCSETFLQTLGDVRNGVTESELFAFWTNTSVDALCEECIYLPLCQGGCRSSYFTKMSLCFAYKPILPALLKWYVSKLQPKG